MSQSSALLPFVNEHRPINLGQPIYWRRSPAEEWPPQRPTQMPREQELVPPAFWSSFILLAQHYASWRTAIFSSLAPKLRPIQDHSIVGANICVNVCNILQYGHERLAGFAWLRDEPAFALVTSLRLNLSTIGTSCKLCHRIAIYTVYRSMIPFHRARITFGKGKLLPLHCKLSHP